MKFVFFCLFAVIISGCIEKKADTANLTTYKKDGVGFSLPGNWQVTEDNTEANYRYVFVETPGDGLVKIEIYSSDTEFTLEEFGALDLNATIDSIPDLMSASSSFEFRDTSARFLANSIPGIATDWNIDVAGVSVPHTNSFYRYTDHKFNAYLTTQVANEDLHLVEDGFAIVATSFMLTSE